MDTASDIKPAPLSKPLGRNLNLGILALAVILAATSVSQGSDAFLGIPVLGVLSIGVAVLSRVWWTIALGFLELASPAIIIFATYALLAAAR